MIAFKISWIKKRIILFTLLPILLMIPISAHGLNMTSSNATEALYSSTPLIPVPSHAAAYSALVTSALLLSTTVFMYFVVTKKTKNHEHAKFSSMIRISNGNLSLSYLQLLLWTYVISFSFIFIYFFRMFNGEYSNYGADFPKNLLALLAVVGGATVSSRMIGDKPSPDSEKNDEEKSDSEFHTLFYGAKQKFSLSKFQMFLWTIMCIIIYIVLFSLVVNNAVDRLNHTDTTLEKKRDLVKSMTIPDVDNVMLVLMGISQGSYLGVKLSEKDSNKDTKVGGKT